MACDGFKMSAGKPQSRDGWLRFGLEGPAASGTQQTIEEHISVPADCLTTANSGSKHGPPVDSSI